MKRYLLAAAALAAITSPATARDGSGYIGIEGGLLFPLDTDFDLRFDGDVFDDEFEIEYKRGLDLDVIAGYDFGMVRAEGELGWKRAKIDEVRFVDFDDDFVIDDDDFGRTSVLSLMGNVLADFGGNDSFGAYAGGGFGRAWVKTAGERDSAWAWQLIAGVRTAVTPNIDVGLKYRYFNTGRLGFGDDEFDVRGRFRSHSLLASVIFNFGAPAVAPAYVPVAAPPPPPPPATQTCPDGTVILATEMCPLPPPPPPPPPPAPERG